MHSVQFVRHGLRRAFSSSSELGRGATITSVDVDKAREYCVNQLRHGDYDSYLLRPFVPKAAQDAYTALRTLNLELARLPETVSNPTIGRFRTQFWRDTVNRTFEGNPPREPISILLHQALVGLASRSGREGGKKSSGAGTLKFWLQRLINTREHYMDNRPFANLAALEEYGEHTYSTLMYMTLASMPIRSMHVDHLASHIGKACGIVSTLRGIRVLAAPSRQSGADASATPRQPVLLLPLDVMAEVGLREEDVFRRGPSAEGLQDAVFKVATRANDHLITAREMLKNLRAGLNPGHDYEHAGDADHAYGDADIGAGGGATVAPQDVDADIRRAFGVLLEAVPAGTYLSQLEDANFDPFKVRSNWKLPWKIWQALSKQQI